MAKNKKPAPPTKKPELGVNYKALLPKPDKSAAARYQVLSELAEQELFENTAAEAVAQLAGTTEHAATENVAPPTGVTSRKKFKHGTFFLDDSNFEDPAFENHNSSIDESGLYHVKISRVPRSAATGIRVVNLSSIIDAFSKKTAEQKKPSATETAAPTVEAKLVKQSEALIALKDPLWAKEPVAPSSSSSSSVPAADEPQKMDVVFS